MNETWRSVAGYEGIYEVSNFGNIRKVNWRGLDYLNLALAQDKDGYAVVTLSKNGQRSSKRVHRLVALAFIDNPSGKSQVNHKDENKLNNRVDNLEWVTCLENNNYGSRNTRLAKSKLNTNCKAILQCDKDGNPIKEWVSISEVERQLGFDHSALLRCCKGKYKSSYGYIWRYIGEGGDSNESKNND
jgi:hypothetical protein